MNRPKTANEQPKRDFVNGLALFFKKNVQKNGRQTPKDWDF